MKKTTLTHLAVLLVSLLCCSAGLCDIGSNWTCVTSAAPWTGRQRARCEAFKGSLWLMGGQYGAGLSIVNDVWNSPDGTNWTRVTAAAPWAARHAHVSAVFQDKLWIMGGSSTHWPFTVMNDIWNTADGTNWTCVTMAAPWPARVNPSLRAMNGKLWLVAGANNALCWNDVWSSVDGSNWVQETSAAPWEPRNWQSLEAFQGNLYIVGGLLHDDGSVYLNDVWRSPDGTNWTLVTSNAAWTARCGHGSLVFDQKLWIMGGSLTSGILSNDVWWTVDGTNWMSATKAAEWPTRTVFAYTVFANRMWVIGGGLQSSISTNDVWKSEEAATMALIPAGPFVMGNDTNRFSEMFSNELPLHTVTVSAFYMDKFEVTKQVWDDVYVWAVTNGYTFDNTGSGKAPAHPVQTINWYDCVKWCNARSEMEGRTPCYYSSAALTGVYRSGQTDLDNNCVSWYANGYRLPTEAEWEKAARGGVSGHRFPWSDADTISHARANYNAESSLSYDLDSLQGFHPTFATGGHPYTSPAGYFAPNGYGLYDMAGNVWERTWDWYDIMWYGSADATQNDTHGPASGTIRVMRGGDYNGDGHYSRVAFRYSATPSQTANAYGFRCVRRYTGPGSGDYCVVDVSTGPTATNYPVSYFTGTPELNDEYKTTKILLRKIPAGTFAMGSPTGELGHAGSETQHSVTLSSNFYMGVFEITQAQWTNVMGGTNPSSSQGQTRPVETISWNTIRGGTWPGSGAPDTNTFMYKLRTKTGLLFDLPTDAQWEYACRAGTTGAWNNGTTVTDSNQDPNMNILGRYWYNKGGSEHSIVGSYLPNSWGLYDMHGNVLELCLDWHQYDLGTGSAIDPLGAESGTARMLRNGGYNHGANNCRSAHRNDQASPEFSGAYNGFRLNLTIADVTPNAPASVSASDGTYTNKVAVTWSAASNATKYTVWRNTGSVTNGASNISGDIMTTNYDDAAVAPGQTYWYWVKAGNAGGWSGFSTNDSGYAEIAGTGSNWVQVTAGAPWKPRWQFPHVVFDGKMWVGGGGGEGTDIWSSVDGTNWTLVVQSVPFGKRQYVSKAMAVFDNKLWLCGGSDDPGPQYYNDVWSSTNGSNWTFVGTAPWSPRHTHSVVAYGGKLWVMGGGSGSFLKDVWCTSNGTDWTQTTATAPWAGGGSAGVVVIGDRLWHLGGEPGHGTWCNDVWHTVDGTNWIQATASAPWVGRSYFDTAVFNGKMWIMGGVAGTTLFGDIWSSVDGTNWIKELETSPWEPRLDVACLVFANRLWAMGGTMWAGSTNDVWCSPPPAPMPPPEPINLTNGLVAYYQFDGNANDSSGYGNNGTPNGATSTSNRLGQINRAYLFDGSGYVDVPDSSSLRIAGTNLTIAAWVCPTQFSGDLNRRRILTKMNQTGSSGGYFFSLSNDGYVQGGIKWVINDNSEFTARYNILPLNAWSHVALTCDGLYMRFYLNGVLIDAFPEIHTIAPDSAGLSIGQLSASYDSEHFFGAMDDVRIYHRTLSGVEMVALCAYDSLPPPSAPLMLSSSDGTYTNKVAITWTASSNATNYAVWRNTLNNTNGAANISGDTVSTNYDDTTVVPSQTYWYWVKAGNADGWSDFSVGDSGYATAGATQPIPDIQPTYLDFATNDTVKAFTIANIGGGSFSFSNTVSGGTWLSVQPGSGVVSNQAVLVVASVNRTGMVDGVHTAFIPVVPTVGAGVVVTCRMVVAGNSVVAIVGGPYQTEQGSPVTFDGSASRGNNLQYRWEIVDLWMTPYGAANVRTNFTAYVPGTNEVILYVRETGKPMIYVDQTILVVRNVAPVVDIGGPYTGTVNRAVNLRATIADPGTGDTHDVRWDFGAGWSPWEAASAVALTNAVFATNGSHAVQCQVRDNHGAEGADMATVLVDAPNMPPKARATLGPPSHDLMSNYLGMHVTIMLDGSGSADDRTATTNLYFDWREDVDNPSKPLLSDAARQQSNASITFVPLPGTYKFHLVVNDGEFNSEAATVQANVPGMAGMVKSDGIGAVLPLCGVTMTATNQALGQVFSCVSDYEGKYAIDTGAGNGRTILMDRNGQVHVALANVDSDGMRNYMLTFAPNVGNFSALINSGRYGGVYAPIPGAYAQIVIGSDVAFSGVGDLSGVVPFGAVPELWPRNNPAYNYQVLYQKIGWQSDVQPLQIDPGLPEDQYPTLFPSDACTVQGTVVGTNGMPVHGVEVRFGPVFPSVYTDQNGGFVVNGVMRGTYFVRMAASDFETTYRTINVPPGDTNYVVPPLYLRGGRFSVYGEVFDGDNGRPVHNAQIRVISTGKRMAEGVTATTSSVASTRTGYYDMPVAKGARTIIVAADGYEQRAVPVDAQGHVQQPIQLEPIPEPAIAGAMALCVCAFVRRCVSRGRGER